MTMLNLYHLQYFYDSTRLGGMTAAAEKNRVGRSAVSQGIRALETSLGVTLLVHQKNLFKLTPEGRVLRSKCEALFSSVKALKDELSFEEKELSGPIHVGASHSVCVSLLPRIMARFAVLHPKVEIHLQVGNATRMEELLRMQKIDLAIAVKSSGADLSAYTEIPLRKGKYILVKSDRFKAAPLYLLGDQGPEVTAFKKTLPAPIQGNGKKVMSIQSWEVIAAMTRQGLGVGLIPDFILEKGEGLKPLRSDFFYPYELCAYHGENTYLTRATQALLESLQSPRVKSLGRETKPK